MKLILFLSLLVSTSCTVFYKETIVVDRYPIQFQDFIFIKPQHKHYIDPVTGNWECFYLTSDTVNFTVYDTIEVIRSKFERLNRKGSKKYNNNIDY